MRTLLLAVAFLSACGSEPEIDLTPVEILGGRVSVDGDHIMLDTSNGGTAGVMMPWDSARFSVAITELGEAHPEFGAYVDGSGLVALGSETLMVAGQDSTAIACWHRGAENVIDVRRDGAELSVRCNGAAYSVHIIDDDTSVHRAGGIYIGIESIVTSHARAAVRIISTDSAAR